MADLNEGGANDTVCEPEANNKQDGSSKALSDHAAEYSCPNHPFASARRPGRPAVLLPG